MNKKDMTNEQVWELHKQNLVDAGNLAMAFVKSSQASNISAMAQVVATKTAYMINSACLEDSAHTEDFEAMTDEFAFTVAETLVQFCSTDNKNKLAANLKKLFGKEKNDG